MTLHLAPQQPYTADKHQAEATRTQPKRPGRRFHLSHWQVAGWGSRGALQHRCLAFCRRGLALLRGRYRYRFLVNARRSANLQAMLRDWIGGVNFAPGVRVGVDVDPYSFV